MALADIPFYGAYTQRRQMNEQAPLAELQQASGVMGLLAGMQKQQQAEQLRAALAQTGGDVEKALEVAVKSGNIEAAHQLAPLVEARRKQTAPRVMAPGSQLVGANNEVLHQVPNRPPTPPAPPEVVRLLQMKEQYPQYAAQIDARITQLTERPERQAPAPQLLQTDSGPMHVGRDGRAVPITGPDGQPLPPKATVEKALPTAAAQKLFENQQNLRRAETALALMEGKDVGTMKGDPDATGWKGFMPDAWLQRLDPKGTDARAALADLGSLVIHERSGAAVTAAEFPRLQPFIPKINDDPETVKKKLKRFAQVYRDISTETANFYRESGYKVPDLQGSAADAPKSGGDADLKAKVEATGIPYEPAKYEYRITNDGKVQRRARGG